MELKFDLWHLAFVYLLTHKAPPNFDVQSEVRLSIEPQRADVILLRRKGTENLDTCAGVLRGLWPRLAQVAVLEYKSPVDYAFKPGDLIRLVVYGMLYELSHLDELPTRRDITLVLVVASITPTLLKELKRLEAQLVRLDGGYASIEGLGYTCLVAVIDDICETERDEYLRVFSHRKAMTPGALRWAKQWRKDKEKEMRTKLEDFGDPEFEEWLKGMLAKMPKEVRFADLEAQDILNMFGAEQILATFDPQQRLAGLEPQQRLAGLDAQDLYSVLPISMLRGLSDDYISSLPDDLQQKIRQRLRDEAH